MFVILRPRPKYFKIKVDVCPSTAIFEVSQSCRVDFQHSIVLYSIKKNCSACFSETKQLSSFIRFA